MKRSRTDGANSPAPPNSHTGRPNSVVSPPPSGARPHPTPTEDASGLDLEEPGPAIPLTPPPPADAITLPQHRMQGGRPPKPEVTRDTPDLAGGEDHRPYPAVPVLPSPSSRDKEAAGAEWGGAAVTAGNPRSGENEGGREEKGRRRREEPPSAAATRADAAGKPPRTRPFRLPCRLE
ncbi:hypothetical protein DAI22_01g261000 [Oryza sativa Japonica Group]|nr:hypothetical protein DAI22_01g261000 [Oryza sativa Japonica Group]